MLRSIGGVVAGVLAGAVIVLICERIGHAIFPPPPGIDATNPEHLKTLISQIPLGAKLAVVAGWFFGVLGGGVVALLVGRRWAPLAWVVAATLFAMAAITLAAIPHPVWMQAGAVAASVLGALGAIRLGRGTYKQPAPAPRPGL